MLNKNNVEAKILKSCNILVNHFMKHGKRMLAYKIIYQAFKKIYQKTKINPLLVLNQAIYRINPNIILKSKYKDRLLLKKISVKSGKIESMPKRIFAIFYLLKKVRKKYKHTHLRLSLELLNIIKKHKENIIKKRLDKIRIKKKIKNL
uniref:ribosomal protein S7 n=1 Tax=Sarcophyte sanguinea TaxID=1618143 RepID=UPI0026E36357|nr:ribosomal protein S7 [Sarcophyte sanguinea]WJE89093.1 ribosomal protein S7 [Sarcophyte sanguinea]WJE89112.1 ribosomal protein S7 [Sarcophyte sanguinea]